MRKLYFRSAIKILMDFLFPSCCFGCGKEGSYICKECHKDILPHSDICISCKRFSLYGLNCINCFKLTPLDGVLIGFSYKGSIKELISKLKYSSHTDCVSFLAHKLSLLLRSSSLGSENTLISYVPSHWWKKHMIRGYNQSELLAKEVSKMVLSPYMKVREKIHRTRSQTYFSRSKRSTNIENSFSLCTQPLDKYEKIIIVDDVITTGSTLYELASVIKKKYPKIKVYGLVIARNG